MQIEFTAIGLEFKAEVTYTPFKQGSFYGPPEQCYPSEPADIEFHSLSFDDQDCTWLLDSHTRSYIRDAAMQAADEKIDELRDEAAADAMEAEASK